MKYIILLLTALSIAQAENINEDREYPPKPIVFPENVKHFPEHWGHPPRLQVRDHVKLPGKFGKGSSTLAKWISDNLKRDATAVPIIDPPAPKPPVIQPKPRPRKPAPRPEIKKRLHEVHVKQKILNDVKRQFHEKMKEIADLTQDQRKELIKEFRESNTDKFHDVKEAQKERQREIREKVQTGPRRE